MCSLEVVPAQCRLPFVQVKMAGTNRAKYPASLAGVDSPHKYRANQVRYIESSLLPPSLFGIFILFYLSFLATSTSIEPEE
jgi:hypothetical protein